MQNDIKCSFSTSNINVFNSASSRNENIITGFIFFPETTEQLEKNTSNNILKPLDMKQRSC